MAGFDNSNVFEESAFGLLPEPERRMRSFGASMLVNVMVAALLLLLALAQVHTLHTQPYVVTPLVFPTEAPRLEPPPLPRRIRITKPRAQRKPTIQPIRPLPAPPKPIEVRLPTTAMPRIDPAPTNQVALLQPVIKPAPVAKLAAFGDPEGTRPDPNANRRPTVATVGAFNGASSPTSANGGRASQGNVQGAGFGSGIASGVPGGTGRGTVASAGFGSGGYGIAGAPAHQREQESTPIVVLAKPLPAYTAEARQLRIEGDVTLEVRFQASGAVQVLRIINRLGHGLDEQAWLAAERIRFRPATKDGRAIDQVSVIHVTFQIA
jgi:TonB family protein